VRPDRPRTRIAYRRKLALQLLEHGRIGLHQPRQGLAFLLLLPHRCGGDVVGLGLIVEGTSLALDLCHLRRRGAIGETSQGVSDRPLTRIADGRDLPFELT
jgi:hypothetical protein